MIPDAKIRTSRLWQLVHRLGFILLLALLNTSCRKDDDTVIQHTDQVYFPNPCEEIPPFSGVGLRPAIVDSAYFTRPIVNPNNPEEIIFLNNRNFKVYKLNYNTGEKNVVLEDGMSFSDADWGVNDWILFRRNQNLFKVKSDGDSLTQITFNGSGRYPNWNPSGNRYLYTTMLAAGSWSTVIANRQDEILDTLPVVLQSFVDWHEDSVVSWALGYYHFGDDTLSRVLDFGIAYSVAGISQENSIHLSSEGGMKILNISSQTITQIQPPYLNCHYYVSGLDYSRQKKKLLAQSVYKELMDDGIHEYIRHDVVWLNLDGTVHEVIDIAQFMNE